MKKYELTGEKQINLGYEVKRICTVRDFGDVKAGDIGGWIESEENLSHGGSCWVYDDAVVCECARVEGDATVSDRALICGNAKVVNNAKVSGKALVMEQSFLFGDCQVTDLVLVRGRARISGSAKLYGGARVYGDVEVSGNAKVAGLVVLKGHAKVGENAFLREKEDIFTVSHIDNETGELTAYRTKDGGVGIICGYSENALDKFVAAVNRKRRNRKMGWEYRSLIKLLKIRFKRRR